ncbi:MAG: serine hydrolase, partial [Blautia sp.]|nr:serine hydrolase [Blautia sp.]
MNLVTTLSHYPLDLTPFVEKARPYGLQGISIWHREEEVGRYTLPGLASSNIYSGSKSILSAAVGFAVSEGLLSLEERVVDAFPAECPKYPIGPLEEMLLKHLLTMSLGFPR